MRNQLIQVYEDMDWNVNVNPADGVTYWSAYPSDGVMKYEDLAGVLPNYLMDIIPEQDLLKIHCPGIITRHHGLV